MIISIPEARKLIGKESKKFTDAQIENIVNAFMVIGDLAIDDYLIKKKNKLANEN